MSKPWSDSTKRMVVAGIGLITLILIYTTRQVLVPIILALLLAYVLQPVVGLLVRARIPRGLAIALIYLALLASLAAIPAFIGPSLFQEVMQLEVDQGAIS
ncbi:MAG: AI-2E family transporter, partial [Chloroflexota bacterium]|nr:AI-2E family transporter [Chloroflexota bacterium]